MLMEGSVVTKGIVSVLVGAALGVISSRVLFVGSCLTLLPWGLAGLLLGAWCEPRQWTWIGVIYGFSVSFVFLASGYSGSASFISRVPFFAALAVFGAACGLALAFLGYSARKLALKRRGDTT